MRGGVHPREQRTHGWNLDADRERIEKAIASSMRYGTRRITTRVAPMTRSP
jgi:hypothetical protein